ncbi:MAG: hypothetical protein IJQ05_07855 [Bacteroidaceae bacterium]|nr:hypothetical protein [Bacteroidaceae bacterium]
MLSKQVESAVKALKSDFVFTFQDLNMPYDASASVIRKLNRMVEAGAITKLSKGRYYKPRQSEFGILMPSQEETVKDLLWKDGRVIGYLTGFSVFNQLGLTTQISNVIEIGTNVRKNRMRRGNYVIRFVLQSNPIKQADVPIFQLLDAICGIKDIPDTSLSVSYQRLKAIMCKMDERSIRRMVILAMNYTPKVRALTGALIDEVKDDSLSKPLYDSLNPVTFYKIGLNTESSTLKKWRIL